MRGTLSGMALALILGVACAVPVAAQKGGNNPGIIPPNASYQGLSYGEWAAEWARWWETTPGGPNHPSNPAGDVLQNQSGHVWFLNGVGPGRGVQTRDITIPSGTALFVPLFNVFASDTHSGVYYGATEEAQRAIVNGLIDNVFDAVCVLDGRAAVGLERYRTDSPQFTIVLPEKNRRGLPEGTAVHGVIDGYWVMVAPLSVGKHTLRIGASLAAWGSVFWIDTTYNITVAPRGQ